MWNANLELYLIKIDAIFHLALIGDIAGEIIMSCNGILILSITWILTSLVWFFAIENTVVGVI